MILFSFQTVSGIGSLGPFDADTAAIVPAIPVRRFDSDLLQVVAVLWMEGASEM